MLCQLWMDSKELKPVKNMYEKYKLTKNEKDKKMILNNINAKLMNIIKDLTLYF